VRAVLDPNVLVSAEIVRRWEGGEFELVVSAEILFELSEVLRRPRFRRYLTEAETLDYVLRLHDGAAEVSEELPKDVVRGVTRDPDDDYIAGVAYQGRADVIVSGDKDLLDLPDKRIYFGASNTVARVLSPRAFLEELRTVE
jgi:putative PIN family toxin of toxin-antitoxin system